MTVTVIFCSLVSPYRKHSNGGSEDIRRRIGAVAAVVDLVEVYAIDYKDQHVVPNCLPENVRLHPYHRSNDPRPWRWFYPLPCIRRYNRNMILDIRRAMQGCSSDLIVFIEGMQLFGLWSDIKKWLPKNVKTILRVHNIESQYHGSVAGESKNLLKIIHRVSAMQYGLLEKRLLANFTYLYAISVDEMTSLSKIASVAPAMVQLIPPIPSGHACKDTGRAIARPVKLCYFGDLTLPNNYQGMHWFCQNILCSDDLENVELHVAGKGSERFEKYDSVCVHGFVNDIHEFVCKSDIVVAPIFSGGGVKIKVLDSISYGRPIITTPKGAEGFPEWIVNSLYIASQSAEFVALLKRMIENYEVVVEKSEALRTEVLARMGSVGFQRKFLADIG